MDKYDVSSIKTLLDKQLSVLLSELDEHINVDDIKLNLQLEYKDLDKMGWFILEAKI